MTELTTMMSRALFLLPMVVTLSWAFPNGAHNNGSNPMDALSSYCTAGNFRPNHGSFLPQASPSPYVIKVTSPQGAMYSPNQAVTITIEGAPATAGQMPKTLKGFFLQGDSTEGAFGGDIVCSNNQGKPVTFCSLRGVTHTNAVPKNKVTCTWTPPDFQLGEVQFTATVLENFTNFWTGVKSEVTLYSDPSTMTYTQKAQQMTSNLMKQWQGASQNILNAFKQTSAGNQMANMLGGSNTNANSGNSNPFASLMNSMGKKSGATTTNQFASLLQGNGGGNQNNPTDTTNYWASLMQGNQRQTQNANQGYDLNNFRQFFQN